MPGHTTPRRPGGRTNVCKKSDAQGHREFTKELLRDLQALERMLLDEWIESDVSRIGVEQELFIVGDDWMPACLSPQLLEEIDDPQFTTELAQYNLEINIDPLVFDGKCLARLESRLHRLVEKAESAARRHGGSIVLAGILPTLFRQHVGLEFMTPRDRYRQLNETAVARTLRILR